MPGDFFADRHYVATYFTGGYFGPLIGAGGGGGAGGWRHYRMYRRAGR